MQIPPFWEWWYFLKSRKTHEKESRCKEVYGQTDVVNYHIYWLWRESHKDPGELA